MPASFDLIITADNDALRAELRLLDAAGAQLSYRQVELRTIAVSKLQGLFNLREFVRSYSAKPGEVGRNAVELVADLGVCLANEVLGEEIFGTLAAANKNRTLRVQLPGADSKTNNLAAALARVPWEIARAAVDAPTLAEKNLVVRAVHGPDPSSIEALTLDKDEALRVLFIFAEAPGSRPLAARQERRELLRLFEQEVYPRRRIEADFLVHGVTRERLRGLLTDRHGYHIVHWSGHGHLNQLELMGAAGRPDRISGEELVQLFNEAGGFVPRLFFLSACHSGDVLRIEDWAAFKALAEGREPDTKGTEATEQALRDELSSRPGYTGTAHALLHAGVPSVVAMRYQVGDDYARDLAVRFYRAILAATNPASVAEALNLSRNELRREGAKEAARNYAACDHATPVLYGLDDAALPLRAGKSSYKSRRDPRLVASIRELSIDEHPYFVGRNRELAGLGAEFIGHHASASVHPVALVQGIGGMGKTALTAEVIDLWQWQFDWLLLFQAKPNALNLDNTLRSIHGLLTAELKTYHEHVKENPADAIWRAAEGEGEDAFRGERRMDRLRRNLIRDLKDEAILLVFDNFETNLKEQPEKPQPGGDGDPVWACQYPAWDQLLRLLAIELRGTASRVLITCRRPLSALPAGQHYRRVLGPLPPPEAALYRRSHPGLQRLAHSPDVDEQGLIERVFLASRFHPLLLDRLAKLATGGSALRPQLEEALKALKTTRDFTQLPELFAARGSGEAYEKELAYLHDALESSIDLLLRHAGPEARLLLWIIALANDPIALDLLRGVWSGNDVKQEQLQELKALLERFDQLPPEQRARIEAQISDEDRQAILASQPSIAARVPDLEPLLHYLVAVGLVTEERRGPEDKNPHLTCHELVRERIFAWMAGNVAERKGRDANTLRLAYADRLVEAFENLLHQDMTTALEDGRRALVYCVQASDYERLGSFASKLVTSTTDPRLLGALLPHLETAVQSAPEGEPRWSCLTYLADAMSNSNHHDVSLPLYKQASEEAKAACSWSDVAWITGNWAHALRGSGNLGAARTQHLESAEAKRQAGQPQVNVIGSELGAYRIDVTQGRAVEVLPEMEQRLAHVESWWQRTQQGETVPEAPDASILNRTLLGALNLAVEAHFAQKDWATALTHSERIIAIGHALHMPEHDIGRERMNRANLLARINRYSEAQTELQACLEIFTRNPVESAQAQNSLASLFAVQGDLRTAVELERRALATREQFPDPQARATSHHNLAIYLKRTTAPSEQAESACHQHAALAYRIVAELGQDLQGSVRNYAVDLGRAKTAGTSLNVPRLADLLAQPAFRPLAEWLDKRNVDRTELQAYIDELLDQLRRGADEGTPQQSTT